jgi:hypothetical protein
MGDRRGAYGVVVGRPSVDGKAVLKWIFQKWDWEAWTELIWLRKGTVGGHL